MRTRGRVRRLARLLWLQFRVYYVEFPLVRCRRVAYALLRNLRLISRAEGDEWLAQDIVRLMRMWLVWRNEVMASAQEAPTD